MTQLQSQTRIWRWILRQKQPNLEPNLAEIAILTQTEDQVDTRTCSAWSLHDMTLCCGCTTHDKPAAMHFNVGNMVILMKFR